MTVLIPCPVCRCDMEVVERDGDAVELKCGHVIPTSTGQFRPPPQSR